eukprot:7911881-Pyramimonas_sp.AAC.2
MEPGCDRHRRSEIERGPGTLASQMVRPPAIDMIMMCTRHAIQRSLVGQGAGLTTGKSQVRAMQTSTLPLIRLGLFPRIERLRGAVLIGNPGWVTQGVCLYPRHDFPPETNLFSETDRHRHRRLDPVGAHRRAPRPTITPAGVQPTPPAWPVGLHRLVPRPMDKPVGSNRHRRRYPKA